MRVHKEKKGILEDTGSNSQILRHLSLKCIGVLQPQKHRVTYLSRSNQKFPNYLQWVSP